MLDAFIIAEIKRRERNREDRDRPVLEIPLPNPDDQPRRRTTDAEDDEKPPRGVIVIDLLGS